MNIHLPLKKYCPPKEPFIEYEEKDYEWLQYFRLGKYINDTISTQAKVAYMSFNNKTNEQEVRFILRK